METRWPSRHHSHAHGEVAAMPDNNPAQVLILEDEPFIAMDLRFAFEDAGVEAYTASTCDQAMALIEQQAIDVAVLDVNLGNGETCEDVAFTLRNSGKPFALHTGDLDRAGEYLRKMKAPIIAKPTPADRVVEQILALLPPPPEAKRASG